MEGQRVDGRTRTGEREAPLSRTAAATPATAAGRVLALQRTAGNRAVAGLLARQETVTETTDPRLEYRRAGEADSPGLGGQRLPYTDARNPLAGWDGRAIVERLTQHDESDFTSTDEMRCAANAALAIAILSGPRPVLRLAAAVQARAAAVTPTAPTTGTDEQWQRFSEDLDRAVAGVSAGLAAANIQYGFGTYGDLDAIADAMKKTMSRAIHGFSTGVEAGRMAAASGLPTSIRERQVRSRVEFVDTHLARLRSGDAYIVCVDTDVLAAGTALDVTQCNHFVVVWRDGDEYRLYDPYPRAGAQVVSTTDYDFWTLFENAQGEWKAVWLVSRTNAARAGRR